MVRDFVLSYLESLGVSKVQGNRFWESCTRPKARKIMRKMSCRISRSEIERLLVQNEAESAGPCLPRAPRLRGVGLVRFLTTSGHAVNFFDGPNVRVHPPC